jgi:hypothetical protein
VSSLSSSIAEFNSWMSFSQIFTEEFVDSINCSTSSTLPLSVFIEEFNSWILVSIL